MNKRGIFFYVGCGLAWTIGISAGGALLGGIAFPVVGTILGKSANFWDMAIQGVRDFGFLASIWSPGIGIVMAIHRAYRDRHPEKEQSR